MAGQKSKRRSRKPRNPSSAPRAVPSQRRDQRAERQAVDAREDRVSRYQSRKPGGVGDPPPSPFGGLPISEVLIFVGAIALVVGFINKGGPALIVGMLVVGVGVLEFTAREHFSGYRSHTTLLAAVPAVVVEAAVVAVLGKGGFALLPVAIAVFGLAFLALRRQFAAARHARVARPPMS